MHGHRPPPPARPAADPCLPAPAPQLGVAIIYGRILDAHGVAIAGAAVVARSWHYDAGNWRPLPPNRTTTDADGRYQLSGGSGTYRVEATAARHRVIGVNVTAHSYVHRLDLVIDLAKPITTVDVVDAKPRDTVAAGAGCEWQCPGDYTPAAEWWHRDRPCPSGTFLVVHATDDRGVSSVACESTRGELHGPASIWTPGTYDGAPWSYATGWYEHGERCGGWHDDAKDLPAPPP